MRKIKILFFGALLFNACLSKVFAEIPFPNLNGVHKWFVDSNKNGDKDKNLEALSPIFGFSLLKSNFISNLRFMGNFKFEKKENGDRDYSKDKGLDAISRLTKILFPSTGGQLSTETSASTDFGRFIKGESGVKIVALLLKYVYFLRNSDQDYNKFKFLEELKESLSELNNIDKNSINNINKQIKKIEGNKLEQIDNFISATDFILRALVKANNDVKIDNKTMKDLLMETKGSIEEKGYPEHLTEYLITAFFWRHFNKRKDLSNLIKSFLGKKNSESIVGQEIIGKKISNIEDLIKDIEENDKNEPTKPEAYVQKEYGVDYFTSATPYPKGNAISNGICKCYDRQENKFCNTFADCVEVSIRHLFNLMLFNKDKFEVKKLFEKIDFLVKKGELTAKENSTKEDFKIFYLKQNTKDMANDGSEEIRSLWNKVVGDIIPGIYYTRQSCNNHWYSCELFPGFLNSINLIESILGVNLTKDELTADIVKNKEEYQRIIEEKLKAFFGLFDDKKIDFEINLGNSQNFSKIGENKVPGYFEEILSVKKASFIKDSNKSFSFDVIMQTEHQFVGDIRQQIADINTVSDIELPKDQFYEPLKCLSGKPDQLLYMMLGVPSDNDKKIAILKKIAENPDLLKSRDNQLELKILSNIINSISWDDSIITYKAAPHMITICKNFKEIIDLIEINSVYLNGRSGIQINDSFFFLEKEIIEEFFKYVKNIKKIKISSRCLEQLNIDLYKIRNIKLIDVECGSLILPEEKNILEDVSFYNIKNSIDLSQYKNIKKLNVTNVPKLILPEEKGILEDVWLDNIKIDINLSEYKNIKKLHINSSSQLVLPKEKNILEELSLKNTKGYIDLSQYKNLIKLDMSNIFPLILPEKENKLEYISLNNIDKVFDLNLSNYKNLIMLSLFKLNIKLNLPIDFQTKTIIDFEGEVTIITNNKPAIENLLYSQYGIIKIMTQEEYDDQQKNQQEK